MIKLTNAVFESMPFAESVKKLEKLKGLSGRDTGSLVKFLKELEEQNQNYLAAKGRLIKEYDGDIQDNGSVKFTLENEAKVRNCINDLLTVSFELDCQPITYSENLDLTIREIVLLNGLIEIKE
jgi:hypothetical protein